MIMNKCGLCGKNSENILIDCESGESYCFCSWNCLSAWLTANKCPQQPNIERPKERYGKTLKSIPSIISMRNEGKSQREIAKTLGVSINTVKSILNPNYKINTLGATSKVLRLLLTCVNNSVSQINETLKIAIESNHKDCIEDIYMEEYVNRLSPDEMRELLNHWLNELEQIDDNPHNRGATIALTYLIQYYNYLDNIPQMGKELLEVKGKE
jgi:DNA-binding CsgD family transcriptional regulator